MQRSLEHKGSERGGVKSRTVCCESDWKMIEVIGIGEQTRGFISENFLNQPTLTGKIGSEKQFDTVNPFPS